MYAFLFSLDLGFRMFHLKVNKLFYITQVFKFDVNAILFKVMCKESYFKY